MNNLNEQVIAQILKEVPEADRRATIHGLRQVDKALHKMFPMSDVFLDIRRHSRVIRKKSRKALMYDFTSSGIFAQRKKILVEMYTREERHAYIVEWEELPDGDVLITALKYVKGIFEKNIGIYSPILIIDVDMIVHNVHKGPLLDNLSYMSRINNMDNQKFTLDSGKNILAALMYFVDYRIPKELKRRPNFRNDKHLAIFLITNTNFNN